MVIAIVTGASSGMGRTFVRAIAERCEVDEVWAIARRADRLEALAAETVVPVRALPLDLAADVSYDELGALLEREAPGVLYLVNAAGLGSIGTWKTVSQKDADAMIDVNCRALVRMTQLVLPHMVRGGHVIELASCSAFTPLPHLNVYAASKAFVQSYTRSLRWELFGTGICATAVCPAWVRTEFVSVAQQGSGAGDIRHFPLAQKPETVVRRALRANRMHFAVACCGVPAFLLRIVGKFLPHCVTIAGWEGLRRL